VQDNPSFRGHGGIGGEGSAKGHKKGCGGYLGHAPTRRGLDLALATAKKDSGSLYHIDYLVAVLAGESDTGKCPDRLHPLFTQADQALANTGMVADKSTPQPCTDQFLPLGIPAPPTTLA